MHELALADAVITTALAAARREGIRRIVRIDVTIGELQRIERDVFEFALREVLPAGEPLLASARIELEIEPVRFRCRPCSCEFGSSDTEGAQGTDAQEAIHFIPELAHAFVRCPQCHSPDFEVTQGRGVAIRAIEGDTE